MLKIYLKIAWRNLFRQKVFSFINVFGLAIGLACSILIMLWVQDELSVDAFHANKKHLYQIYERQYANGKVEASYVTQGLLADELKKTFPEIQYVTPLELNLLYTFTAGNKINKMTGTFAGSDFFNVFRYPLVQGTPATALNKPASIAISRKMAEQFFGSPELAIGKTMLFENRENLLVTAIFENLPVNSSQQFDFLRTWEDFSKENAWVTNWGSSSPATYVQLRPDADALIVEAKIKDFVHRYIPKENGFHVELALQPYTEKFLNSTFANGQIDGGRIEYVRLFSS